MIVHITMDSKNFEGQYFNAAHVEAIDDKEIHYSKYISIEDVQHADRVISESSCIMLWNIFQILLQFNFSHKFVKSQHWITDVQIILN